MATRLEGLYLNKTSDDVSYASDPTKYVKFEDGADKLVFAISEPASMAEADLNSVQTVVSGVATEISNLYLWDDSESAFVHIPLASSGAYKYVFLLHMTGDDGTLTEPTLQIWDDSNHNSNSLICLGETVVANSFVHVIETRIAGTPDPNWNGTKISGSTGLPLNGDEALTEATDLYFNLYIKIPATVSRQEKENPVFCLRYKYGD